MNYSELEDSENLQRSIVYLENNINAPAVCPRWKKNIQPQLRELKKELFQKVKK